MRRFQSIHPVFFAVCPVASLLANNLGQIDPELAVRALGVTAAGAIGLLVVLSVLLRDGGKASLMLSGTFLAFFSYGHVYGLVKNAVIGGLIVGRHRFLLPVFVALLASWVLWVWRGSSRHRGLHTFFHIAGLTALLLPAIGLMAYALGSPAGGQAIPIPFTSGPSPIQESATAELDIYYIILDGYGRQDVLRDLYGYDNSAFLDYLNRKGFYVADESRSNYMMTVLSLASSLNMEYLDPVAQAMGTNSSDVRPLIEMVQRSRVRQMLADRGYQMVAFDSGWTQTQVEDAELYLTPGGPVQAPPYLSWSLNEFEILLLRATMIRPLLDRGQAQSLTVGNPFEAPFNRQRDRILFAMDTMAEIPTWDGSYFVFAHLVIPHPPFLFGPDGEPVLHDEEYSFQDGSAFLGTHEEYLHRYRDQVTYVNKLLRRLIDQILETSDQTPIIILQGEHGPRAFAVWGDTARTNMREAFGIFNAYLFPAVEDQPLYSSVSPVNSFRILIDQFFEGELGVLPDQSYYATPDQPYGFVEMTDRARTD